MILSEAIVPTVLFTLLFCIILDGPRNHIHAITYFVSENTLIITDLKIKASQM